HRLQRGRVNGSIVARAVRSAGIVAEVVIIIFRQSTNDLTQNGKSAITTVEYTNRIHLLKIIKPLQDAEALISKKIYGFAGSLIPSFFLTNGSRSSPGGATIIA